MFDKEHQGTGVVSAASEQFPGRVETKDAACRILIGTSKAVVGGQVSHVVFRPQSQPVLVLKIVLPCVPWFQEAEVERRTGLQTIRLQSSR